MFLYCIIENYWLHKVKVKQWKQKYMTVDKESKNIITVYNKLLKNTYIIVLAWKNTYFRSCYRFENV